MTERRKALDAHEGWTRNAVARLLVARGACRGKTQLSFKKFLHSALPLPSDTCVERP